MIAITQLRLPAVSPDGMRALELLNQDEPDIQTLIKCILRDSVSALALIKYANSPLFRRATPIDTVHGAIRVLGLRNVRSALLVATIRGLAEDLPKNCRIIAQHCTDCAFLAARLAQNIQPGIVDEMAFLGLIHDMGMLILASNFPDDYSRIMDRSVSEGEIIGDLEEAEFSLRHDDIIERIFKDFRLPTEQIDLLSSYHREICLPDDDPQLIRRMILDLAHALWIDSLGEKAFHEVIGDQSVEELTARLGIVPSDLATIKEELEGLDPSSRQSEK